MMRALIVLVWLASSAIARPQLRHEDIQLVRPELSQMTVIRWVPKGTGWFEAGSEIRIYDGTGHIVRHELRRADRSIEYAYDYVWSQGRLASYTRSDSTRRTYRADYTWKLDAQGRITERVRRDPSKPVGEFYRDDYAWAPDGSHTVRSYRHYPKEGPYPDGSYVVDASGRMTRSCEGDGSCSMYEFDAQGSVSRVRVQNKEDHWYHVTGHTYDKTGKHATRTVGSLVEHFTWNARGDVAEILVKAIAKEGGAVGSKYVYTYKYR